MELLNLLMLLSILIFLIVGYYFFFYQSKGILRINELEEVKQDFSNKITNPKYLIMGGSDVLYSFDTDRINKQTEIPTVNLGTNVGLGLGYLLDFTTKQAKSGDTIIACLAYSLYTNPPYHMFAFEYFRMYDKKKLKRYTIKQFLYYFLGNVQYNLTYVQKYFNIGESGCYIEVIGSELEESKNHPLRFPTKFNETESIRKLNEFKQYCYQHNINLIVTYPSTLEFKSYENSYYLKELMEYLKRNYQVIGEPSDYFVPKDEIFNSVYHVNKIGQQKRTDEFINYLHGKEIRDV